MGEIIEQKEEIFEKLKQLIIEHDEETIKKVAEEALGAGIHPVDAIKLGLQKGMEVVGEKFKNLEIFLPDVVLAADAMYAALSVLLPRLTADESGKLRRGKVVIGTIFGDIHDIGKNIVAAMLAANGYEIYDLGCDVDPKRFVEKAEEVKADIIAISCLLSPSIYYMEDVVKRLRDLGIRDRYYVIVGGAAVPPEWAGEIEADGWGKYVEDAVQLCNILVEKGKGLEKPVIVGV
jgi:corrinoid protein of di/trimethylamine methyltransferase